MWNNYNARAPLRYQSPPHPARRAASCTDPLYAAIVAANHSHPPTKEGGRHWSPSLYAYTLGAVRPLRRHPLGGLPTPPVRRPAPPSWRLSTARPTAPPCAGIFRGRFSRPFFLFHPAELRGVACCTSTRRTLRHQCGGLRAPSCAAHLITTPPTKEGGPIGRPLFIPICRSWSHRRRLGYTSGAVARPPSARAYRGRGAFFEWFCTGNLGASRRTPTVFFSKKPN